MEFDQEPLYLGVTWGYDKGRPRDRRHRAKCLPAVPIRTTGAIPKGREAWIYLMVRDSMLKIGMTTDPKARARTLGGLVRAVFPVVPAAARLVESAILARLGAVQGDGEWVPRALGPALVAVEDVFAEYRRMMHVDPHLTPDEARQLRITLAMGGKNP